ncbi:MAG TPA: SurA N-terminal domain-containing protein [Puia sp.]|nr:SurA N-terminal domain-containing protein [Puia sp.]
MSIIQQIREKAAWLVFGLIALSLVGFLLMDAFVGKSRLFGNRSTVVGVIDGENIEYTAYMEMVSAQEDQYKQQGYPVNEAMQENIRETVWHQMVEDAVLAENYSALGLQVGDKEQQDMLVGPNAIPDIKRAFTDPKTGIFDAQAAAAQINQIRNVYKAGPKKNGDNRQYDAARRFFEESLPQMVRMRLREKYMAMLANSGYVPKWMIEKTNADNSQLASISFVNTPYFTVPDSTAKVSDAEIQDYIDQHKESFQQEESRSLAYVTFDASPSAADTARLKQQLSDLAKDFAKTTDIQSFLARVGSEGNFFDGYLGKSRIQVPNKDSIFSLPKGGVFGPYLDGGSYTVAKLIDNKTMPDSARARHILVGTVNPQTGQPILEDSVAKKKIDSIKNLLEHGANWDSIALKFSDDQGSKEKGGDLGYFTADRMVKEFSDFCFNGKKGEKKIVKSQFGYHYIEILDQKDFEPAYKIAYMTRKIETSPETDQAASGLASQFAGTSRNAKAFDENVEKQHLQKQFAPEISPNASTIPGLGPNRQLVKWAYESDPGSVSEPYPIGDKYIVALLTDINKAGTMSVARARNQVEPMLRNKKKAAAIMKKEGSPASLDAAASAAGQNIQHADSVLFAAGFNRLFGSEGKVVGYAFNKTMSGKPVSPAIPGNGGVFFIKVENVSAMSNPNADPQTQRFTQEQRMRSDIYQNLMDAERKMADVKDYRSKFF